MTLMRFVSRSLAYNRIIVGITFALLFWTVQASTVYAARINIDDFSALGFFDGGPGSVTQSVAGVLGGTRLLGAGILSGGSQGDDTEISILSSNASFTNVVDGTIDATLEYDAGGAGLGGFDLSDGGTNNAFVIDGGVISASDSFSLYIGIISDLSGAATLSELVLNFGAGASAGSIIAPFLALVGSANITSVDAIFIDIESDASDPEFNSITLGGAFAVTPIPIPAALPLFLSALAGLGFAGYRRRRKAAAST